MKRLIAIGDIHGMFEMLELLMKKIQPQKTDKFVFLGDYIDRGIQGKQVIDFLIQFSEEYNCVFLRGNHEDMLLSFLEVEINEMYGDSCRDIYLYNGGVATAISYAGKNAVIDDLKYSIPNEHIEFFRNLKKYHIENNFLFVHAGIRPGIPVKKQNLQDLLWIREEFLFYPTGIDKVVVFGHTQSENVLIKEDKIGVDTGACYKMSLSAIELHSKKVFSVKWEEAG